MMKSNTQLITSVAVSFASTLSAPLFAGCAETNDRIPLSIFNPENQPNRTNDESKFSKIPFSRLPPEKQSEIRNLSIDQVALDKTRATKNNDELVISVEKYKAARTALFDELAQFDRSCSEATNKLKGADMHVYRSLELIDAELPNYMTKEDFLELSTEQFKISNVKREEQVDYDKLQGVVHKMLWLAFPEGDPAAKDARENITKNILQTSEQLLKIIKLLQKSPGTKLEYSRGKLAVEFADLGNKLEICEVKNGERTKFLQGTLDSQAELVKKINDKLALDVKNKNKTK